MVDNRNVGTSYGYVMVPEGGLKVDGVKFPAGPRAAGKSGWYKLLVAAGCREISQAEYEGLIEAGQSPARAVGAPARGRASGTSGKRRGGKGEAPTPD